VNATDKGADARCSNELLYTNGFDLNLAPHFVRPDEIQDLSHCENQTFWSKRPEERLIVK
jgi:hypothetical protein